MTTSLTTDLSVSDPTMVDWPAVQATAWIPFRVVDGRPVNPVCTTGIRRGRGGMKTWAERKCVDAAVTCTVNGRRYVLLVHNSRGWGLPGGGLKAGEGIPAGCSRELAEETGLPVAPHEWQRIDRPRYIPDTRATGEAWPVTAVCHLYLGVLDELPPVCGQDDVDWAAWAAADTYIDLVDDVTDRFVGVVAQAHQFLLPEVLQPPVAAELLAA